MQDTDVLKHMQSYIRDRAIKEPKPGFESEGPQQWASDLARMEYYINEEKLDPSDTKEVLKKMLCICGEQQFLNIASIAHQGFISDIQAYIQNHSQDEKNNIFFSRPFLNTKPQFYITTENHISTVTIVIHLELLNNELECCGYRSGMRYMTMTKEDAQRDWTSTEMVPASLHYFDSYSDTYQSADEAKNDILNKMDKNKHQLR